jgi:phage-related protein
MGKSMVDGMKQVSTVIKGVVKELSGVLKSIITELNGVLQQGVKLVTDVSNKIAEGVMKTFNTVVGGLKQASAQLPSILGNLGKAIGAFFSGMTAGLTTFAMAMAAPTPLFGLPVGLIVVGMAMGLAKAFSIAGPGIEALTPLLLGLADIIGGTFVKAMQAAGPIITSIFNGIATVINSVGNMIVNIITAISTSIGNFATMDAGALASVAWSVTKLAGAVGLFGGASILGAIGSFFGGGVFSDLKDISSYANPIQTTANAVQSLANAFASLSSIDVSSLKQIPWGDMEDFASEGGKFVLASSGGGSFALSKDTTDNIKKMATNTEAMVKLNNTLVKLTKEGFFGGETSSMKLYIDGKDVSTSMTRYKSKTENLGPKK